MGNLKLLPDVLLSKKITVLQIQTQGWATKARHCLPNQHKETNYIFGWEILPDSSQGAPTHSPVLIWLAKDLVHYTLLADVSGFKLASTRLHR